MATTRRAVLTAALLTLVGVGSAVRIADHPPMGPAPDDMLIDEAVAAKTAVIAALAGASDRATMTVRDQQQEHIDALLALRSRALPSGPSPSTTAPVDVVAAITASSPARLSQALAAQSAELSRVLVLIAASEAVHAQVLA